MPGKLETRSDCSRCAALCCIAYPSDEMPGFSARKQAGEACPKLDACGLCSIYATRGRDGFGGCIQFECFGAGQHVVQTLFGGKDWRDDPALLRPMVESFLALRKCFDLLYLVDYARGLGPNGDERSVLDGIETELTEMAASAQTASDSARLRSVEARLRPVLARLHPAPA